MPPIAETSHFEGEKSLASILLHKNDLLDMDEELAMAAEMAESEALKPTSFTDVQHCPDRVNWWKAMEEEYMTLMEMGTWRLVKLPPGANIIGSKWTYKAKKDVAGTVIWKKAHLVAQGFLQVPGVDYFDTFTPVA